jgi:PKD repeat protein
VNPTKGFAPLIVNASCTGENADSYKIVVKQGSNTLQTFNSKTASYNFSNSGNYSVQCFVNNTVTSPACSQDITVDESIPPVYDLALIKTVQGSAAGYKNGDTVTFNIIVRNQ